MALSASSNKIFVYDQDRDRNLHYIATFDSQGRYISKRFVAEARCDLSTTIAAVKVTSRLSQNLQLCPFLHQETILILKGKTAEDTLIVTGSCKSVFLKVLNLSCDVLWEFNLDEPKIQGRKWRPYDTAVDNEGNFLVLDSSGRKVLVFNKEGRFCSQFDPFSIKSGHASKIEVNSEGQVILMDSSAGKLLKF